MMKLRNLVTDLPDAIHGEVFADVIAWLGCRIERIVSYGQVTPADRPYRQAHDEWVLLLAGTARVAMDDKEITLMPGDHMLIPAAVEHRVTFTDTARPSVWLAVHIDEWEEHSTRALPCQS